MTLGFYLLSLQMQNRTNMEDKDRFELTQLSQDRFSCIDRAENYKVNFIRGHFSDRSERVFFGQDGTKRTSDVINQAVGEMAEWMLANHPEIGFCGDEPHKHVGKGGWREGAGRKPKEKVTAQNITVRVRPDYLMIIKDNYESRSDFIQSAIKEKLRREGLI